MEGNINGGTRDEWGYCIIRLLLRHGGFSNSRAIQVAHRLFLRLCRNEGHDWESQPWGQRCDAVAVWALICIEVDAPPDELEVLLAHVACAGDRMPDDKGPPWFAKLAFTLAEHKYPGSTGTLSSTANDLFQTIKLAAASFERDPGNAGRNYFESIPCGGNILASLWGADAPLEISTLAKTRHLLEQLAKCDVGEALFLLVALGMGTDEERQQWMEDAARGSWPTRQLAAFYLGQFNKKHYHSIKLPERDDPEHALLDRLARDAKAKVCQAKRSALQQGTGPGLSSAQDGSFQQWDPRSGLIRAQWELVSRVEQRVLNSVSHAEDVGRSAKDEDSGFDYRFGEIIRRVVPVEAGSDDDHCTGDNTAIEDANAEIRSLTLESARLVEAFLKWCLVFWFADGRQISTPVTMDRWTYENFNAFIGRKLGQRDGAGLTLDELLESTDIKAPRDHSNTIKLLRGRNWDVWHKYATLSELVVANAVAASKDEDHPFCIVSRVILIDAFSAFSMAQYIRNPNAHYSVPLKHGQTDLTLLRRAANEAIYWASEVRARVDEFMTSCSLSNNAMR